MSETAVAWAEPIYLDASALVKLFVPEPESATLNVALVDATDVIVADLALTEMASAIGRRVREGALTVEQGRRLTRRALKLLDSCRHAELTPLIHRHAERLLLTLAVPMRALDALHVSTAIDAGAATMATFDTGLSVAARAQGLFVAPAMSAR